MVSVRLIQQMAGMFEVVEKFVSGLTIGLPPWDQIKTLAANPGPMGLFALFMAASVFMIWRLNAIERKGFEGTLVGTLVMPFCSGFANLSFAAVMAAGKGNGSLVIENCIVNNVTNLTLVIGIPAIFWGINITQNRGGKKTTPESRISRLSLLLSLVALLFFTLAVWLLSRDGMLDASDGMVLTGLFLFWQVFHLVEVMKNNVRKKRTIPLTIVLDFILVGLCAWATFYTIDGLVEWVSAREGSGFISRQNLGFLSGLLMVVPNALLAVYYSAKGCSDIAYASQIGDCHICIPLCIGLYAMFSPIAVPPNFGVGVAIITGAGGMLFVFTAVLGRLPRIMGATLALSYSIFVFRGILG
jgi:cation:H+ antiporter